MVQRVLSAVVLLPLVVVCVWWGFWPFTVLVVIAAVVGLGELYAAFSHGGYQSNYALGVVVAALVLGAMIIQALSGVDLLAPALGLAVMISLAACASRHAQYGAVAEWALTFGGALYVGGLLGFLILLRALETPLRSGLLAPLQPQPGAAWIALVLMATWGQDVFAYFVGKRWGRRKMAPTLSPRKTWEGAAGGMLGALAGAFLAVALFGLPLSLWATALIGITAGIAGPIGDLSESFIKRQVGLKDAGSLIPGHGGILDRIDSVLFSAPAVYIMLTITVS
ncbi:MAG: phosphatidate cytidylyltransferase [Roseiflexus sp.]|nr:phosphatidate cytidylyltransferase [Roseiflexus sp.]MCS7290521.1 phosphatidate cytidylyltransferase [Roseiflexus sp.]MDW8148338.1 phosphatidate cytidylyltransferase [Roseiflexaceae bacterium]MDW8232368.1 phosphatidate cytidylyltransferase [Roseiflexaceae bacterium]